MNSEQAKKLSLPDILARLGHQPVKTLKAGQELWYKSPFRRELEPSFHTSFLGGKWIWNDFGDTGGTVVDFAMRYYKSDLRGALAHLEQFSRLQQPTLFSSPEPFKASEPVVVPVAIETLVLRKIYPLSFDSFNGRALLQYIQQQRGIDPMLASRYLVEVQYYNTEKGKTYFAVGMPNEAKGYEIRNAYFKSSLGGKDISFIRGKATGQAAVFEGFFDFLSALTFYQSVDLARFQQLVESDVIIMNSASFQERTRELLSAGGYSAIWLYLDNDAAGQRVKALLEAEFSGFTLDRSGLYQGFKDLNQFLINHLAQGTLTGRRTR